MSFLAPSPPPPTTKPRTSPTRSAAEIEEARKKERDSARLRRGRAATILTSGSGLAASPNVNRKRLLGE